MSAEQLGAILDLIAAGTISGKIAKDVFEIFGPKAAIRTRSSRRAASSRSPTSGDREVVDQIIADNPEKAEQAKTKPALVGWFVGQVMKSSGGKANPQAVNDLLKRSSASDAPRRTREENGHANALPCAPRSAVF